MGRKNSRGQIAFELVATTALLVSCLAIYGLLAGNWEQESRALARSQAAKCILQAVSVEASLADAAKSGYVSFLDIPLYLPGQMPYTLKAVPSEQAFTVEYEGRSEIEIFPVQIQSPFEAAGGSRIIFTNDGGSVELS